MYNFIVSKDQETHDNVKKILASGFSSAELDIVKDQYPILLVKVHKDLEYPVHSFVHNAIDECVVTVLEGGYVECIIDQIHVIKVHATRYFDLQAHLLTQSVCLEPLEFMLP